MRFKVIENTPHSYFILDTRANDFGMPIRAVSIFFGDLTKAETVCNMMNAEWTQFLHNPT